jgi:hypothetical protein
MKLNVFKNLICLAMLLSISACNLIDSRLNGEWKNPTLQFTIDFDVKNKTMDIKTGMSGVKVKTTFKSIEESGDVVNLTTKDGDKTVVTFKNNDEIEVSTNDIPIALTFNRVKK